MSVAVFDEAVIERGKQGLIAEQELDAAQKTQEVRSAPIPNDDQGLLRCELEAQLGGPMSIHAFMKRLHTINPLLRCVRNPNNPTKGQIYFGDKSLFPCEWGENIPEFSIFERVVREDIDLSFFGGNKVLKRGDLPKSERVPFEFDAAGNITRTGEVIFDNTVPMPGMKWTTTPWSEKIRGWRTVLARLILEKVVSYESVRAKFGDADRKTWAQVRQH